MNLFVSFSENDAKYIGTLKLLTQVLNEHVAEINFVHISFTMSFVDSLYISEVSSTVPTARTLINARSCCRVAMESTDMVVTFKPAQSGFRGTGGLVDTVDVDPVEAVVVWPRNRLPRRTGILHEVVVAP